MADPVAKTTVIVQLLERMKVTTAQARDELVRALQARLEHLARKMLRRHLYGPQGIGANHASVADNPQSSGPAF